MVLLKADPDGQAAPVHGHIGGAEGIVLEGGFGYCDDRGNVDPYFYEEEGVKHQTGTCNGT